MKEFNLFTGISLKVKSSFLKIPNFKHEIDLKAKDRSGNTALTLSNKSKNKQVKRFIIKLLKQDHKRSKRLLGNATSNSRSKYQWILLEIKL